MGVIVSNLLAYAFHFIAGRMLGPEDYGVFGALMALFLLVALPVGSIGIAITKFTSKYFVEKRFGQIAWLRKKIQHDVLIFSVIMLSLIILFSGNLAKFLNIASNTSVITVGIILVSALVLPINRGLLQGMKKFQIYSWNTIIESFSRLILLIGLLYMGFGVNGAIMAYGLAYFIAFILIFPFIKETKVAIETSEQMPLKPIYKYMFLVLMVNLILQSIINVPSLFVKHYYSSEFTGYWTAALNIARISLFITAAIAVVMFPEIAGEKENKTKRRIFTKAASLVILISVGMAVVFVVIPKFLIQTLYGNDFIGAAPILKWMGLAMIFVGLLQLWTSYFLAGRK